MTTTETATRTCFHCHVEKPLDDKHFVATTRPGGGRVPGACRAHLRDPSGFGIGTGASAPQLNAIQQQILGRPSVPCRR
jgi:hypothetical protein